MLCQTYLLRNVFECNKVYRESTACPRSHSSGFHHFERSTLSGKRCINLCWRGFIHVHYRTMAGRNMPREGVCGSSRPSPVPLFETSQTSNTPVYTYPYNSNTSVYTPPETEPVYHTAGPSTSLGQISSSSGEIITEASMGTARRAWYDSLSLTAWAGLGSALVVTIVVAVTLVICRRRVQKEVNLSESKTRLFYVQPFGYSEGESSVITRERETSRSTSALLGSVSFINGKEFVSYAAPGSEYCTIADVDAMSWRCSDRTSAGTSDIELRPLGPTLLNPLNLPRDSVSGHAGEAWPGDMYSKLSNGNMRSAADVPRNMLDIYDHAAAREFIPRTAPSGSQNHLYVRLDSRTDVPTGRRMSVPETYNIAACDFKQALNDHYKTPKRFSSVDSGGQYVVVRSNHVDPETSVRAPGVRIGRHCGKYVSGRRSPRVALQGVSEDTDPFSLGDCGYSDGSSEAMVMIPDCTMPALDQREPAYFMLEDGAADCTCCNVEKTRGHNDSLPDQVEYFEIGDGAGTLSGQEINSHPLESFRPPNRVLDSQSPKMDTMVTYDNFGIVSPQAPNDSPGIEQKDTPIDDKRGGDDGRGRGKTCCKNLSFDNGHIYSDI